jgi:hypothetical protein
VVVNSALVLQERVEKKIFLIRGKKVMLDRDLALLYEVTTGNLNKAVSRNFDRFPDDFMFLLNKKEFKRLMFQNGISSWGGTRKTPRVFTEHGILMLSSVLNSKRAVMVNIQIMRVFTKLRELLATHKDLQRKIEDMESKYDEQFKIVFETISQLLEPLPASEKSKGRIGFVGWDGKQKN